MDIETISSVLSILIIEDNLGDIRVVQEVLKESLNCRYYIDYCHNLSDGLSAMSKKKFDALILDLRLPDSSDLDTLKIIKSYNPEIPIIVLTIDSNEELGLSAIKVGAQDFFIKGNIQKASLEKSLKFAIERKRLERKVKTTEDLFEITFEQASVGMSHLSANKNILKVNQKMCDIVGYNKLELVGKNIDSFTHKDDIKIDGKKLNELLKGVIKNYSFEKRLIRKDGTIIWVNITRTLIKTEDNPIIIFSILEDITLKKRTEQILNESFENYKLLAENSPDIIVRLDKNLNFLYVNSSVEKIEGKKPEELIGRNLSEFIEPERLKIIRDRIENAARSKKKQYYQEDLKIVVGERTVEVIYVPELDKDGEVNSFFSISRDITERIEAQKEIERKNILLEKILENIPAGVWIVDEHGNMIMHNKASEEIWGGTRNISIRKQPEFKGWWADSGKKIEPEEWASFNAFKYGKTYLNQIINIECFDGIKKTMMNSAVPMFDNNKKVIGVVVINQDITKLIQIENDLKSSLADKEMLMKEIHHRVKNNFQIISSLLSLQINSPKNKSADEILSESRDRVKSMAILHEKLYKSHDINSINFEGYIKGVLNNLQSSYRLKEKNISLEIDIDEVIVSIDSAINLGLIINEIVVNSLKHAFTDKAGGTIIIRLKEKEGGSLY